ncbi:MAG: trypsin-like peptidase domain-containing protein, partial [Candidatus Aminicenantes bacterium]
MSFYKKDYIETQRKRNTMIALASVALIIIIVFSYNLLKKSPEEETGPKPKTVIGEKKPGEKPKPDSPTSEKKDRPTIIKETRESVVLIKILDRDGNTISVGSGFIINDNGDIISNRHVFRGAHQAEVETTKGKFTVAKVQAQDANNDLVRLSLGRTGRKFKPIKMSDSMPEVGESIMVIGNPLGLEATVSSGIVSARRKFLPFGQVIQITCPISPGSSGSPVLNMKGEVIGVATFQMVKGQNLNFAIPIAHAKALKPSKGEELASVNFETTEFIESLEDPFDQGMILYGREQYEGAIPFFKQAVEKDPQNAEAYYHLGICYRETRATAAIEAFKKAIE